MATTQTFPETGYITSVIHPLLKSPESLVVERTNDEKGVLITLKVAKSDMGRLIGKQGSNIKALRTIAQAYGARTEAHISIKVLEPEKEYGTDENSSR